MTKNLLRAFVLLMVIFGSFLTPVKASADIGITLHGETVKVDFPTGITFSTSIVSDNDISKVVLEYYNDGLTCSPVIAKAYPQFSPSEFVNVEWTWEMRQSGSIPIGSIVHYRWRITDSKGQELLTPEEEVIWIDSLFQWKILSRGMLNIHWYEGGSGFANDLLQSGLLTLAKVKEDFGFETTTPINVYVYSSNEDFLASTLYIPDWSGGRAYEPQGIITVGIPPDSLEWGKDSLAHEITHILQGQFSFSCMGTLPTWLSEGIAGYEEHAISSISQRVLDNAIDNSSLLSINVLNSNFAEDPVTVSLEYIQSYSIVKTLLENYGKDRFMRLLVELRSGSVIENALKDVYGFGLTGLEEMWRQSIKADLNTGSSTNPTPTTYPTTVHTFVPLTVYQQKKAPESVIITPSPQLDQSAGVKTQISSFLIPFLVVAILFVLALIVIVVILTRRKSQHE